MLTPVKSDTLKAVGYNIKTQTLVVQFQTNRLYAYNNVERSVYFDLMADKGSKGKFFNQHIRDKFPTREIDVSDLELLLGRPRQKVRESRFNLPDFRLVFPQCAHFF